MTSHRWLSSLVLASSLAACTPEAGSELGSGGPVIDPSIDGKMDNYRSPIGQEYLVQGDVLLRLSGEDSGLQNEALDARLSELARAQVDALTKKLDARLWEIWPENQRDSRENIVVMVRTGTTRFDGVELADEYAYRFTYVAEIAGPLDLLDRLPLEDLEGGKGLTLTLDDGSATPVLFSAAERTPDAYPGYLEMFEDGSLDIGIIVGGDHVTPRNDVNETRAIYDELVSLGLTSPVANFEALKVDSGPFTGRFRVGLPQRDYVDLNVRLAYADSGTAAQLVDRYKENARTSDIVIYRGHAGTSLSYSGVVVQYQPERVAIPATEFRNLDLPDRYQIFVFDGCETYTGYADQIYAHENKDETNADVITSVNYGSGLSRAETVRAFLKGMLSQRERTWLPLSWDTLLTRINAAKTGAWTPIYGVHGLEDNTRISPLANLEMNGQVCAQQSDCGGIDNLCVQRRDQTMRCAAACADSSACPEGTTCRRVQASTLDDPFQCL